MLNLIWSGVVVFVGLWILGNSIHISGIHILLILAPICFCYNVLIGMQIDR